MALHCTNTHMDNNTDEKDVDSIVEEIEGNKIPMTRR